MCRSDCHGSQRKTKPPGAAGPSLGLCSVIPAQPRADLRACGGRPRGCVHPGARGRAGRLCPGDTHCAASGCAA